MRRRKVIAITDGDWLAQQTVEQISAEIGGSFISRSGGNPTPLNGPQLVELIKEASREPILVVLDDRGHHGVGKGEEILKHLAEEPSINLLGVVAVASNIEGEKGVHVDFSVTNSGEIHWGSVDKKGYPQLDSYLVGDTVSILPELDIPLIVGTGDTGKMDDHDNKELGSPITLQAIKTILDKTGNNTNEQD